MSPSYTLVIGTRNWSSWSLRPWLALKAVGLPFQEKLIRLRQPTTKPEVSAISPSGHIPLLKVESSGQGFAVWDSLAIVEYLAEAHPEASLWPTNSTARATARSLSAEMHSGFAAIRQELSMDFARRRSAPKLSEAALTGIARIETAWNDVRHQFGGGGPFLFGRFSIADCFYAPVVSRFTTYGIVLEGAARDYAATMIAHPAMAEWGRLAEAEVAAGLA
ncbi:MAG: glutathione S-transferase [Alphaproteobacteria bacterium]|nr:glutathione S-transferase [Alphaproteobacteria bacterium]